MILNLTPDEAHNLTPDEAHFIDVLQEIAAHVRNLLEDYPACVSLELRKLIDSLDLVMPPERREKG